jgi:N-acetylmuramoyl-L-alanine amidase
MEKIFRVCVFTISVLLVVGIIKTVTIQKFDRLRETMLVSSNDVVSIREREQQLECLAKNIYYEAGNEPFEGKVAVAQVTMNRVDSGKFGNGVCGVVYQKNIFYEKVVCQFSWYCDRTVKLKPIHKDVYEESMEVAKKVLLEGFRLDVIKTAMYYHADYVNPGWNKQKIGKIGRHIFYKG